MESFGILILILLALFLATFTLTIFWSYNKGPAAKAILFISPFIVLYCIIFIYDNSVEMTPEILKYIEHSFDTSFFARPLFTGVIALPVILVSMYIARKYFTPKHPQK